MVFVKLSLCSLYVVCKRLGFGTPSIFSSKQMWQKERVPVYKHCKCCHHSSQWSLTFLYTHSAGSDSVGSSTVVSSCSWTCSFNGPLGSIIEVLGCDLWRFGALLDHHSTTVYTCLFPEKCPVICDILFVWSYFLVISLYPCSVNAANWTYILHHLMYGGSIRMYVGQEWRQLNCCFLLCHYRIRSWEGCTPVF
jgi:hypothetical protein